MSIIKIGPNKSINTSEVVTMVYFINKMSIHILYNNKNVKKYSIMHKLDSSIPRICKTKKKQIMI